MSKLFFRKKSTGASPSRLFVGKRKRASPPLPTPQPDPFIGKLVSFGDGQRGRVEAGKSGEYVVKLAIPDNSGVLVVTDCEHLVTEEVKLLSDNTATREAKVRVFNDIAEFTTGEKMVAIREHGDKGRIIDYEDVTVSGLASTFKDTTPSDRDGDYVEPTAFDKTIRDFLRNPVMLIDHRNSVSNLAGSFTKVGKVKDGLAVEGRLSNAPDVQSVRFKVAEGHLRAFSIGGLFLYGRDGKAIEEVILFEVSLVPVPANQDALFTTRALNLDDCSKAFKHFKKRAA